jgi:uridine kinase
MGQVVHSPSTWQPADPSPASVERVRVLDEVCARVLAIGRRRIRVAIDGPTASGKSTFGHELAARVANAGRTVLRASLDDFKRPWSEAQLYDRTSGAGYYRNAYDTEATRRLLLLPAAPAGTGRVALCSIDPLTQVDHSADTVAMPADGVLVVDGVFAFRPALDDCWDLRVWLHVDAAVAIERAIARDTAMSGGADEAERVLRDRYLASEALYVDEVNPRELADVVIDNTDVGLPRVLGGPR